MVTRRPNFFLDSKELGRALGTADRTHSLYLAPFDLDQIEKSLRTTDESTRAQILDLAGRDGKFREVVARPSLLYIVSVLWQRENLSRRAHIDSALVIDLFIRQSLKRQRDKQDERRFMVLNSAERHYFMAGIATYMAAKGLPNQIDGRQLEEAVEWLVDAIPDAVSQSVSAVGNQDSRPLRSEKRLAWPTRRAEIMRKINTEVRSCGLLVTDPTKDGAFKFAHESYMELLQVQTIGCRFSTDEVERSSGHSIANTWRLSIGDLQDSDEAMGFLAELLRKALHGQGVSEDPEIAKGLWDVLMMGQFSSRQTLAGFFMARWVGLAGSLAGRLVNRFGVERRGSLAERLFIGLLTAVAVAVIGAVIGAVAVAVAVIGAVAVAVAQGLVEGFGWLWWDALLLTLSTASAGALVGLVVGLAMDFFSQSKNVRF